MDIFGGDCNDDGSATDSSSDDEDDVTADVDATEAEVKEEEEQHSSQSSMRKLQRNRPESKIKSTTKKLYATLRTSSDKTRAARRRWMQQVP